MTKTETAVTWAIDIADDNSHGYSQQSRWGLPDYDCSSLVITAWELAGVPVKTNGATYTGNMRSVFLRTGFELVTDGTLRRGDVLLNELHHTALYIGAGKMVEARISELGTTYGTPGDQTGNEIRVSAYRDYPWDCVLRYTAEAAAEPEYDEPDAEQSDEMPIGIALPVPKKGDSGDLVAAMQHLLLYLGYRLPRYGADGEYGAETAAAVSAALDGAETTNIWEVLVFG